MEKIENLKNRIICGDCLEVLKTFPSNSVDTIITDPPAGISFMNKDWDSDKGGRDKWIEWLGEIMKECYRVAKPGATALVWAIPRTSHWTALAIEKGDWVIKDCIYHIFGSGFPKASDISSMLDKDECRKQLIKKLGRNPTKEEFKKEWEGFRKQVGKKITPSGQKYPEGYDKNSEIFERANADLTEPNSKEAKLWDGWKSHSLKPAVECWWLAMKPNEGSYAENALKWGVAGLNIDKGRIPSGTEHFRGNVGKKITESDWKNKSGFAKSFKATDSLLGRFPANLVLECNCDEVREGKDEVISIHDAPKGTFAGGEQGRGSIKNYRERSVGKSIIHTNPECPCYILDQQSGINKSSGGRIGKKNTSLIDFGLSGKYKKGDPGFGDSGGASRFFYCAKASKSERNLGLEKGTGSNTYNRKCLNCNKWERKQGLSDNYTCHCEIPKWEKPKGNLHPTVKPFKLMEYLCLLTKIPKGGIVLDPFAGSGTTCMAAKKIGRDYIGIEIDRNYCEIANKRINSIPQTLL